MSNAPEGRRDLDGEQSQEIPIDEIDTDPQVREEPADESLPQLSKQINRHGLLQGILLRRVENRYKVVCGGRRFLAAKMASSLYSIGIILSGQPSP